MKVNPEKFALVGFLLWLLLLTGNLIDFLIARNGNSLSVILFFSYTAGFLLSLIILKLLRKKNFESHCVVEYQLPYRLIIDQHLVFVIYAMLCASLIFFMTSLIAAVPSTINFYQLLQSISAPTLCVVLSIALYLFLNRQKITVENNSLKCRFFWWRHLNIGFEDIAQLRIYSSSMHRNQRMTYRGGTHFFIGIYRSAQAKPTLEIWCAPYPIQQIAMLIDTVRRLSSQCLLDQCAKEIIKNHVPINITFVEDNSSEQHSV